MAHAPMSPLDPYRKQAKQLLRWHRDGYVPVAASIREMLPRFAALSDAEILAAAFRLSDAQELVARKQGQESWAALARTVTPLLPSHAAPRAVLTAAEPQLFVTDMARALAFYAAQLGFRVAFAHGEPPFYAQVVRDAARLNLRLVHGDVFAGDFRAREVDALSATLTLDAVKPLFLEYQERGVAFHQRLRQEPWGARTFLVPDPDGNLLAFVGR
jgi:catechol 2,3-dioxygenase-like lactoylglutathione lyase family enzyme